MKRRTSLLYTANVSFPTTFPSPAGEANRDRCRTAVKEVLDGDAVPEKK